MSRFSVLAAITLAFMVSISAATIGAEGSLAAPDDGRREPVTRRVAGDHRDSVGRR